MIYGYKTQDIASCKTLLSVGVIMGNSHGSEDVV